MAAAITTTATTLEGQYVEVAIAMQNAEKTAAAADPDFEPRLTLAPDAEGGTLTISATLPVTLGGTAGNLSLTPQPYLP